MGCENGIGDIGEFGLVAPMIFGNANVRNGETEPTDEPEEEYVCGYGFPNDARARSLLDVLSNEKFGTE